MTQPLCYSNAEWLSQQIDYARLRFSEAREINNRELIDFWADRWNRLERHYKDLRGV